MFSSYQEAVENSIIFESANNVIDKPLTNSILAVVDIRIYMQDDFIVEAGTYSKNTYILLDGECVVYGMNDDVVGYMRPGAHYSNNLPEGSIEILDYKRPINIITKTICKIGILKVEKLNILYDVYPEFKKKL